MTNRTGFPLESVVNDKQDGVPSRICRECQFYSQSENTNARYMTIEYCIRKYMILYDSTKNYSIDMKPLHEVK